MNAETTDKRLLNLLQMYANTATKPSGNPVKDLTFRLEQLDRELMPLRRMIERKIQRVQARAPGHEYVQRELEALIPALEAFNSFRNDMCQLYTHLADCFLENEAENKILRKRDNARWNANFKEAVTLARAVGARLDEQLTTKYAEQ